MTRAFRSALAVFALGGLVGSGGCGNVSPSEREPDCSRAAQSTAACEGNVIVAHVHYTMSGCGADETIRTDCARAVVDGTPAACLPGANNGDPVCVVPCHSDADCPPTQQFTYYCSRAPALTDGRGACVGTLGVGGACTADNQCGPGLACLAPPNDASAPDAASAQPAGTCHSR